MKPADRPDDRLTDHVLSYLAKEISTAEMKRRLRATRGALEETELWKAAWDLVTNLGRHHGQCSRWPDGSCPFHVQAFRRRQRRLEKATGYQFRAGS